VEKSNFPIALMNNVMADNQTGNMVRRSPHAFIVLLFASWFPFLFFLFKFVRHP
jgi:hypothetical protein